MTNPTVHSFEELTVRKLATNVTSGTINKHRSVGRDMTYISTYRLTGETTPTLKQMQKEGVLMFQDNPEQELIEADAAIDVYCYCNNPDGNSKIGKLVVWI